jgi:hypothetical protein
MAQIYYRPLTRRGIGTDFVKNISYTGDRLCGTKAAEN